jgi:hypothetical protein
MRFFFENFIDTVFFKRDGRNITQSFQSRTVPTVRCGGLPRQSAKSLILKPKSDPFKKKIKKPKSE